MVGPMQNTGNHRAAEVTAQISEEEMLVLKDWGAHWMARRCPARRDVGSAVWDRSCAALPSAVLEGVVQKGAVGRTFWRLQVEFHGSFRSLAAGVCQLALC